MRFVSRALTPVPRPELADARVLAHNVTLDAELFVSVGAMGFRFARNEDGDFEGGEAVTIGRGSEVDEAWLTAARLVAIEALRHALREAGGEDDGPATETIRCDGCGKLLCSAELVPFSGKAKTVECGPEHVVTAPGMVALTFESDGSIHWLAPLPA